MKYVQAVVGRPRRAKQPIRTLISKVGGDPVGIACSEWPTCRHCDKPMAFLAQLNLREPVRVSDRFSFAYLFMCRGFRDERGCPSWDPEEGSNCVVLKSSPDASSLCACPGEHRFDDFELSISERQEPVVENSDMDELPDDAFLDASGKEFVHHHTSRIIKVGGIPIWMQSPETLHCPCCKGPMKFIAQVGSELENPGFGGYGFDVAAGEFFVFRCEAECSPQGAAMSLQTG